MRKVGTTIDNIIEQITKLKGQNIDLEITRGRKKTIKYTAKIEDIYPSIFNTSFSYSYADVLCGAVSFKESLETEQANSV